MALVIGVEWELGNWFAPAGPVSVERCVATTVDDIQHFFRQPHRSAAGLAVRQPEKQEVRAVGCSGQTSARRGQAPSGRSPHTLVCIGVNVSTQPYI